MDPPGADIALIEPHGQTFRSVGGRDVLFGVYLGRAWGSVWDVSGYRPDAAW